MEQLNPLELEALANMRQAQTPGAPPFNPQDVYAELGKAGKVKPQQPVAPLDVRPEFVDDEQETAPAPAPRSTKPKQPTYHPVLDKLNKLLGISHVKEHVLPITVNGVETKFTLRACPKNLIVWANTLALHSAVDESDYTSKLKVYLAATYVSKIDGVPLAEVFSVKPEEGEVMGTAKFCDFLMFQAKDALDAKLYDAYEKFVEPNVKVMSELDSMRERYKTYICPKCSHEIIDTPSDYWCYRCEGTKLEEVKVETSLPLA